MMTEAKRIAAAPTLEDVARASSVSTATVSRCLNNPDQVTKQTRARVMAAVEKLNYTPNFGARALAARRTDTFGAVIPTMDNAIFARGLQAFQEALAAKGGTMLVASSNYDPDTEERQIRNLVARGADGLLLIGAQRDPAIYDFLRIRGVPVVVSWATGSEPGICFVGFDNFEASRRLTDKALKLGHRHVAFISATTANNDRARARVEGARAAMALHGLDPDALEVIETLYSISNGRDAFLRLMQRPLRPTLILCGNDVLAVGAINAAREAGLAVPGDISITGFDDIELATVVSPSITTVHVPHRKMGALASETLMRLASGDDAPPNTVLDTQIVERDSLGPPPQ